MNMCWLFNHHFQLTAAGNPSIGELIFFIEEKEPIPAVD